MTDNPNYKITFMLDSAAMITVHTPKRGVVEVGLMSMTAASEGKLFYYVVSIYWTSLLMLFIAFFRDVCFQVKPLGVIWGKYREFYNRRNTIMFDDIGRNFLMNPQNGLKVSGQPSSSLSSSSRSSFPGFRKTASRVPLDPTIHEGPPEQRERQGAV